MDEETVKEFVTIRELQKQNSTKQKTINAKKDAAKATIIAHLQNTGQTYIQVADSCYLVLQKKKTKQSYTPEFLNVLYRAFARSHLSRDVSEEEGSAFESFCMTQADRLGSTNVDLVMSKSRPLASMLSD